MLISHLGITRETVRDPRRPEPAQKPSDNETSRRPRMRMLGALTSPHPPPHLSVLGSSSLLGASNSTVVEFNAFVTAISVFVNFPATLSSSRVTHHPCMSTKNASIVNVEQPSPPTNHPSPAAIPQPPRPSLRSVIRGSIRAPIRATFRAPIRARTHGRPHEQATLTGAMRNSHKPGRMSSTLSRFPRKLSARPGRTEALVTLFKRDSISDSGDETDDVAMSQAGQKVIPATFNLVPIASEPEGAPGASVDSEFEQAGGHDGNFLIDGTTLVKKVTDREAVFYERAQAGEWPTHLLPRFHGRTDGGDAIKIENLTYGFSRPCVIDLKMGVQTVEDDETSFLKKLKMNALDRVTGTKNVGCRLEGLSMYRTLENRRVKGTKAQSHSISAHMKVSLQDVLTFFLTDESGVRSDVALRFQVAIESILAHFEKNDKFRFIGSSILLIYDNDNRAPYMHWARALRKLHTINPKAKLSEDQISGLTRQTRCDIRMIDFAHTGPMPKDMDRDYGYITGLNSILSALRAIRATRAKPIFSMINAVVDAMEQKRSDVSAASVDGVEAEEFTFSSLLGELTPLALGKDDVAQAETQSSCSSARNSV